jgi:hypothetical protein
MIRYYKFKKEVLADRDLRAYPIRGEYVYLPEYVLLATPIRRLPNEEVPTYKIVVDSDNLDEAAFKDLFLDIQFRIDHTASKVDYTIVISALWVPEAVAQLTQANCAFIAKPIKI